MKNTKKLLLLILLVALISSLCAGALIACDRSGGIPNDPLYRKDMDIGENPNTFEEYTLERGPNERQVIFYWREAEHDYDDNDIWMWEVDGAEGRAFEFHPCKYGAKAIINVPATTKQVGFIVRKDTFSHSTSWDDAGKVYEPDRFAVLTGDVTEVYLTGANQFQFISKDGGKTLSLMKEVTQMSISSLTEIQYGVVPAITIDKLSKVTVKCDGKKVAIESVSTLGKSAETGTIKLKGEIDLTKNYEVTIKGYEAKTALPIGVFDSSDFGTKYNYDGDDLGAVIKSGSVEFKVWAPIASKVVLNLYEKGNDGPAPQTVDMVLGERGVWSYTVENKNDAVGKYYTYTVTTSAGTQEAVDPYAKSAGVNGNRGMVIDLNDTNPTGFENSQVVEIDAYTDAVIWETHVRDFSNNIADSQYKGKYLAFTETGLTNAAGLPVGVDYLTNLGITHVHLLPVFDFASVDEASTEPQFNWGYDPKNYNVPEGSYSTNPSDGKVRVVEFKQMVQALHNQGLGVVMDMVYNHTYDKNSNLNKIVPNYYYRYNTDGTPSSGSGCGNDTASERYMFSKYMVDSVSYWVKEYKLDGLRFDLMGLHDLQTMRAIEKAVHEINPNAILYGEGWTMTTAAKKGTVLATQQSIKNISASEGAKGAISVFNDVIRDGLRGSVFDAAEKGYLADSTAGALKVAVSIAGTEKGNPNGWSVTNGGTINYISAHDNNTLWDKLAICAPEASKQERLAMNRMGAAIVMLSKGTPFMTAGEEILRSKVNSDGTFNSNSYNSSDEVNNLKWESLTQDSDEYAMMLFYKGLIEMRKSSKVLTANSGVTITVTSGSTMVAIFDGGADGMVVAVINNAAVGTTYALPEGNWSLVCNGTQAGATELAEATGEVTIPANTVHVYFSK